MYNRYIPQADGSFKCNRVGTPDSPRENAPVWQSVPQSEPAGNTAPHQQQWARTPPPRPQSASSFLKQLLPKNLDTGDLLVIILLLLMAGDNAENKSSALLTLALYLFL